MVSMSNDFNQQMPPNQQQPFYTNVPQPQYVQMPPQPPVHEGPFEIDNILGFVGFLLSLVGSFLNFPISLALAIGGIVCSILAMKQKPLGFAYAGFILGIVVVASALLTYILTLMGINALAMLSGRMGYYGYY